MRTEAGAHNVRIVGGSPHETWPPSSSNTCANCRISAPPIVAHRVQHPNATHTVAPRHIHTGHATHEQRLGHSISQHARIWQSQALAGECGNANPSISRAPQHCQRQPWWPKRYLVQLPHHTSPTETSIDRRHKRQQDIDVPHCIAI